ncbi:MAG: TetR/AcrR family transcriptional regulator [Oliverpabstia sp.]
MRGEELTSKKNIPIKVEKLFDAVIHLLEEGKDAGSLTVSEITEKAGIGKGTAYEYFRSKEEMIARAILYGIFQSFQEIEHRIAGLSSFEKKYLEILNWLEEIYREKGSLAILCQIARDSLQITGALKHEIVNVGYSPEMIFSHMDYLLFTGEGRTLINSSLSVEIQKCTIFSSFVNFWIYINRNPEISEKDMKSYKKYLYHCLINNLQEK